MIHSGPFVRHVWGIHRDPAWCHNPHLHRQEPWRDGTPAEAAAQAWFRVERQTTLGFPHLNRALFTIRYFVEPLTAVAADPWRRERLASALAGMDEEEMAYKGLIPVRDRLVAWLQA
jgi:dimethylamine monooxygenase subunit A